MKKIFRRSNLKKKSQGHVEMIISFLIFLGALFLIFLFINPFSQEKSKDSSLSYIQKTILENVSQDVGKLSVIVNDSNKDCYDTGSYGNNFVEVPNGRQYDLYFNLSGNGIKTCAAKDGRNFTIGVYSNENMILYENVLGLVNNYKNDYITLKNNLGITDDLSFSFKDLNGNVISAISVSRNIPSGVEVNSNEFPVRVINESASINELILNIKVW